MSDIRVTIQPIIAVKSHNNADRLEVIHLPGSQSVVGKGEFHEGENVVFFPPDILIPPAVAARLEVTKYLKGAAWGELGRTPCRVGACRLRGIPSYGFVCKIPSDLGDADPHDYFQAKKYEQPDERIRLGGNAMAEPTKFHRYTNIEHYWRNHDVIAPGTEVYVTEKIHGANCRLAKLFIRENCTDDGSWQVVCGSHRCALLQQDNGGHMSAYWKVLEQDGISLLLDYLSMMGDVILYGEIYGPGIQFMDYAANAPRFALFDISVDGVYFNREKFYYYADMFDIQTVPLIYHGPFDPDKVQEWTNGPTLMVSVGNMIENIKSKFKGREGCVIVPANESYDHRVGRVILKSVSADYLAAKES